MLLVYRFDLSFRGIECIADRNIKIFVRMVVMLILIYAHLC